jgi:hypothetical protein
MFEVTNNPFEVKMERPVSNKPMSYGHQTIERGCYNHHVGYFESPTPIIRNTPPKPSKKWLWVIIASLMSLLVFYIYTYHYNKVQTMAMRLLETLRNENV